MGDTKKKRPARYEFGEWGAIIKNHLPPRLRALCVDLFFRFAPVSAICLFWKELDGYFQLSRPGKGDVVVDAGAWTGHFTVVAARLVGPRGRVIAIEPQKLMCERMEALKRRLRLSNVVVVNSALFDRSVELKVAATNDPGFTVFTPGAGTGPAETVTLRTLDDILSSLAIQRVDFVKMDIEGAEIEALCGMRETLSALRPFVAIASYHVREGATTSFRVEEILKDCGYCSRTGHRWHLTTWGWVQSESRNPRSDG